MTTSVPSSTFPSAQSLTPLTTARVLSSKPKKPSDRIASRNCCGSFFYNIPRGSVMLTIPGFAILVIGAILVATVPDRSTLQSWPDWRDGLQLISFIFLILGGAWSIGAIGFWIGAWCRYKPKKPPKASDQWSEHSAEVDLTSREPGLELVRMKKRETSSIEHYNPNPNGAIYTVS